MCSFVLLLSVQFKVGLCQLSVTADKERNIAHARKAIEEAAKKGAQLVVLPVRLSIYSILVTQYNFHDLNVVYGP